MNASFNSYQFIIHNHAYLPAERFPKHSTQFTDSVAVTTKSISTAQHSLVRARSLLTSQDINYFLWDKVIHRLYQHTSSAQLHTLHLIIKLLL